MPQFIKKAYCYRFDPDQRDLDWRHSEHSDWRVEECRSYARAAFLGFRTFYDTQCTVWEPERGVIIAQDRKLAPPPRGVGG